MLSGFVLTHARLKSKDLYRHDRAILFVRKRTATVYPLYAFGIGLALIINWWRDYTCQSGMSSSRRASSCKAGYLGFLSEQCRYTAGFSVLCFLTGFPMTSSSTRLSIGSLGCVAHA